MNKTIRQHVDNLFSDDAELRYQSFLHILKVTDKPVAWAYDVWDELLAGLRHKDNHVRAIAAQVLCNLAKSDPKNRMLKDFNALLAVTRDERFVTARHTMQALWKVGVAGKKQQRILVDDLGRRFNECITERNCTLIRYDILSSLRNVYGVVKDEAIKAKALALIEMEKDPKYRKKYATLWRAKRR